MEKVKDGRMPHQGENIRFFRTAKNIKQDDFANQLGLAQSSVTKLERRKVIDDNVLLKSANILGVSIEVLKELDLDNAIEELGKGKNITFENFRMSGNTSSVGFTIGDNTFNPTEMFTTLIERLVKAETELALAKMKEGNK